MRPGEELLDGPPIHGNTRLEIIWTAIPAIILVGLCTYAFVVLRRRREGRRPTRVQVRVVGEQFAWTFYYRDAGGKEIASPQLLPADEPPVQFTIQSKDVLHDFWVPAFRMKKDAVPGIDVTLPRHAEPDRHVPDRLRRAVRPRARDDARERARRRRQAAFDEWLAQARQAGGRRPRRRRQRGGGGAAPDGKALFTVASRLRRPATRWPTRARPAPIGPDLDKVLKGKDAAFIKQSIVDPERRDRRRATRPGSCRRTSRQTLPAGRDRRAGEVPFGSDEGGLMTARLRAPGLPRAGLFLVLGVLFCAGDHRSSRERLRLPDRSTADGLTTQGPERRS